MLRRADAAPPARLSTRALRGPPAFSHATSLSPPAPACRRPPPERCRHQGCAHSRSPPAPRPAAVWNSGTRPPAPCRRTQAILHNLCHHGDLPFLCAGALWHLPGSSTVDNGASFSSSCTALAKYDRTPVSRQRTRKILTPPSPLGVLRRRCPYGGQSQPR